jgi:O-acetyl-ADP-ribose deacetylase (regulator of RNase III)
MKGMLYPVSVVDGLVHQLGGYKLAMECKMINLVNGGCPAGTAVETSPGNEALKYNYDRIIHVTPPFFKYHDDNINPIDVLHQCYRSALDLAFEKNNQKVACPLIGAGARGFPYNVAISVAVNESRKWLRSCNSSDRSRDVDCSSLLFGIPDPKIADIFVQTFNDLENKNR